MTTETGTLTPDTLIPDAATLAGIHSRLGHLEDQSEQVEGRLDGMEGRLDGIDGRLDGIDIRLDGMDVRLGAVEGRLDGVEGRLGQVEVVLGRLEARFEATLPYLASKADIAELRTDGERLRADMERQLRLMTWTLAGVILAGFTLLAALLRLWG